MLRPVKRRLEYKKEYEEFKLKMTLIATAAAFSSLFIYSSRLTDAMFAFLLLYYYCSVILREHILIVNGSRIRKWWLVHHYLSVITSGILLVRKLLYIIYFLLHNCNIQIWPSSPSYDQFRGPFLWFCLFLGALQYLQYRYQKQRLYVLIALEKANPMDTVTGEGVCNDKAGWDFALLVPFSILGQVWQLYSSVVMYEAYHSRPDNEWQIAAFGILFFALGVGNMLTTFQIFVGKLFGKKDKPPSRSASDEALNTKLGNKTK